MLPSVEQRIADSQQFMQQNGFTESWLQVDGGRVKSFFKPLPGSSKLHVYIEGDGKAYMRRNRVSSNPTPGKPVAQKLAALDDAAHVLYLARPCQYERHIMAENCPPRNWTIARYSRKNLHIMVQALLQARTTFSLPNKPEIGLIGYSGGGVMAALLAAQHADIAWFATVAANLDIDAWTRHHNDSPLSGSENPTSYAEKLSKVRQIHWLGRKDKTVPLSVSNAYFEALGDTSKVIRILTDNDHYCCWEKQWPEALQKL